MDKDLPHALFKRLPVAAVLQGKHVRLDAPPEPALVILPGLHHDGKVRQLCRAVVDVQPPQVVLYDAGHSIPGRIAVGFINLHQHVKKIDEDIVTQILDAENQGALEMELHVPKFTTDDNWPMATYSGGSVSRFPYTLWRHGLIDSGIYITVVPDEDKNIEFGIS